MAWLLTHAQAKFAPRRKVHTPIAPAANVPAAMAQMELRTELRAERSADLGSQLAIADALRACPKCQSQNFTDRKVTKEQPASADASRNALP